MAGRPKSFDTDKAMDAFVDVFWSKGYAATSIDDLQKVAGIKRGSFYAAFGSKDKVFEAVLRRYWEDVTEAGLMHLKEAGNPLEGIGRFLHYLGDFMSQNTPRGCLLLASATNQDCTTEENRVVADYMGLLEKRFTNSLESSPQNKAHPNQTQQTVAFVLSSVMGLNAMARTGHQPEAIRAAADFAARSVLNAQNSGR